MEEKMKSKKKNFFWNYEKNYFSKPVRLLFLVISLILFTFAILSVLVWHSVVYVPLLIEVSGVVFLGLAIGPMITRFHGPYH